MKKTKSVIRRFGALSLAAAFTLGLAGCGVSGGNANTNGSGCTAPTENTDGTALTGTPSGNITFQTTNLKKDFSGFFTPLIQKFQDQNPGVTVTWVDDPGDNEFGSRMLAQARACDIPDVVNLNSGSVIALEKAGQLIDFSTKSPGIGAPYVQSIWNSITSSSGTNVALPWYKGGQVQTFNKDLMTKAGLDPANPPKTTMELIQQATEAAKNSNGQFYAMNANPAWTYFEDMNGMGVQFMNSDFTSFTFGDDPNAIAYVDALAKAYAAGAMPKDSLTGSPDPSQAFSSSTLIWGTSNASFLRYVKQNAAELYPNVGVAAYPRNPGITPGFDGQFISVPNTSKNAVTAVAFAKFLTNNENQLAWAKDPNVVIFPTTTEALNDPFFTSIQGNDPMAQARRIAAQDTQDAVASPIQQYYTAQVDAAVLKELQLAIAGSKSASQALQDAQSAANSVLQQATQSATP